MVEIKAQMKLPITIFVGAWQTVDEDSRALFVISREGNRFVVRAFDDADGEEFVVSNVRVRSHALYFETFVKSSKYRARHVLRPISSTCVLQELTIFEKWKRLPDTRLKKFSTRHGIQYGDGGGDREIGR